MKKILSLCLAFSALAMISCNEKMENDSKKGGSGGGDAEKTDTTSTGKAWAISTIYELNHSDMEVNSHADVWRSSRLEADYNYKINLKAGSLEVNYPIYPRVKRMANGKYLLLYMEDTSATDCYYAISDDLKNWEKKGYIFQRKDNCNNYKNPDAVVLDNGDIIAVANYQGKAIVARRSTDNALTWGAEKTLYVGGSMEPSILQLQQGEHKGEIQVYYTKCNTSRGYSHGYGDSGTGLIRSTDGGKTWVNDSKKIIRQYTGIWPLSYTYGGKTYKGDGLPIYTDQMAVGVELNAGLGIAVACESRFVSTYTLTMAYNYDNWTENRPDEDKTAYPADRWNNWLTGAGPYLRQFPSGETLISYRANNTFYARMGNSLAREFDKSSAYQMFPVSGGGCWGSIELDDSHVMIGTYPYGYSSGSARVSDVYIGRFILNHQIFCTEKTPVIDGDHSDWADVQEALFIGSETPTGVAFRFAHSADNLYIMIDRSDADVTSGDITLLRLINSARSGSPFVIKLTPDGKGSVKCDQKSVTAKSYVNNDKKKGNTGYTVELSIPLDQLSVVDSQVLFNAAVFESGTKDLFDGVLESDSGTWFTIEMQ